MPAEDRGNEVRERLSGAGARFGQKHASGLRGRLATAAAISTWPARGSKAGNARASGPSAAKMSTLRAIRPSTFVARPAFRLAGPDTEGTSGTAVSTSARIIPSAPIIVGCFQGTCDQFADRVHVRFAHPARGDGRRADTDPARDHRRVLIEGNRILVDRDAGLPEGRLGDFARKPFEKTSTSMRWLSVPPLTSRNPADDSTRARRVALATI